MSYTSNFNLNQRVSYLESVINDLPSPNLTNVLITGNNAGESNIDLNGNDLLNVNEITFDTTNPVISMIDSSLPTRNIILDASVPNITITDGVNTNVITPLGSGGTTANALNVEITDVSNNQTYYPIFAGATTGFNPCRVNSDGLTYNAETEVLSLGSLPECSDVPTSNTQLVNKLYVDNKFPVAPDTLSAVLTAGNTANNSIILTDGVDTTTISKNSITTAVLNGNVNGNASSASATAISIENASDTPFYPTFVSNTTGDLPQKVDTNLTYNPVSNTLTTTNINATTFTGALSGNASTASAVNVSNTGVPAGLCYPTFVDAAGTNKTLFIDNAAPPLSYNTTNNQLNVSTLNATSVTATTLSGALTGSATNVIVTNDNTNGTYFIPFSKTSGTGSKSLFQDDTINPLTYNPSSGLLTATAFAGNVATTNTTTGTVYYPAFLSDVSGNNAIRADTALTFNADTNTLATTTFTGALNGNASSATLATTATDAINTAISIEDADNNSFYPTFVSSTSGNLPQKVDTNLTYNPVSNRLTATLINANTFTGNLSGTATTATNTAITSATIDGEFLPTFVSTITNSQPQRANSNLTYNPSFNRLTATTFSGALNGNASTATTATNANNAAAVGITDTTTGTAYFVPFVGDTSGNQVIRAENGLRFDASNNILTTTTFTGALNGNASSATTAANATLVATTNTTTGTVYYPAFLSDVSGNNAIRAESGLTFDASNNILTTTTFSGALAGNASTATLATTATNANNVNITSSDNASETCYIPFSKTSGTGNKSLFQDDTTGPLTYNPSNGRLTATSVSADFNGNLLGNASSATTAANATLVATTNTTTGTVYYPAFLSDVSGNNAIRAESSLTFDASNNILATTTFSGALNGNATSANTATLATNATNVATTNTTSGALYYPAFLSDVSGNNPIRADTALTFNADTNTLRTSALQINSISSASTGITINANVDLSNNDVNDIRNLSMDYINSSSNTILLDEAPNNDPYPLSNPVADFQTRITKNASDNLDICQLGDISLTKNIIPTAPDINTLTYTQTTLATAPVASTLLTNSRAVFPNNKVLWANYDSVSFTKVIYVQNFANSSFATVDLSSVTAGSANYSARLSSIYVAQLIPVYYNSQTDCKFFIRLAESVANNNLYILKCEGDPTLSASYTYATQYLSTSATTFDPSGVLIPISAANRFTNGQSWTTLPAIANAAQVSGARSSVALYDSENDLFVIHNGSTGVGFRSVSVVNSQLTAAAVYHVNWQAATGYTNNAGTFNHGITTSNILSMSFTNNTTNNQQTVLHYYDAINKRVVQSPFKNTITDLPAQFNSFFYLWDTFAIDEGGLLYFYYVWLNNTVPSSKTLNLACYSWDKTTSGNLTFVSNKVIQNIGAVALGNGGLSTYSIANIYVCLRVYNTNNIQIFSSFAGVSGTNTDGNLFISDDGFNTVRTITITGITNGFPTFLMVENEILGLSTTVMGTIYPPIQMTRSPTVNTTAGQTLLSLSDIVLLEVNQAVVSTSKYLTFDYNLSTAAGTVSSTRPITYSAAPLTLSGGSSNLAISGLATQTEYNRVNIKAGTVCQSTNYYAEFIQTGNQAFSASTPADIQLPTTDASFGITIASNVISFNTTGLFKVGISMLVEETGGSGVDFYFSFTDAAGVIPNSGSVVRIAGNNEKTLSYAEILYRATSSAATIKCVGYTTSAGLAITSYASPDAAIAASPGVILTIYQIE